MNRQFSPPEAARRLPYCLTGRSSRIQSEPFRKSVESFALFPELHFQQSA